MRSKQLLSLFIMTFCIVLFQNCGGESVNEFEQPFLIELDEENILSGIHALDLKGASGFSKAYIKKLDERGSNLAFEIATSKGDFFTLNDFDSTLQDYLDFKPVVLEDVIGEPRLILLNNSRNRLIEISVRGGFRPISVEYEADLIERVNEAALKNSKVEYEGQDRVVNIGLNSLMFSDFRRSSLPTPPVVSCIEGFTNVDQRCMRNQLRCSQDGGRGFRNLEGNRYGPCIVDRCEPGHTFYEGQCFRQTQSCSLQDGQGVMVFDPSTGDYGACQLNTCNSGFGRDNSGTCVRLRRSCDVSNGVGIEIFDMNLRVYRQCQIISCNQGYTRNGGRCIAVERSCNMPGAVSAIRPFNPRTGSYGACEASTCNEGYTLTRDKTCTASFRTCQISNGQGRRTYDVNSGEYRACRVFSCNSRFSPVSDGTACIRTERSCPIENGTGFQRYTGVDRIYGSCNLRTCNQGFLRTSQNACVARYRSCNIANGRGRQEYSTSNNRYGRCNVTSCNSGYLRRNNSCIRFFGSDR